MVLRSLRDCRRILANVISGVSRCCRGRKFHRDGGRNSVLVRPRAFGRRHRTGRSIRSRRCLGENCPIWFWRLHARKGVRLHLGSRVARIEDKQVLLQGGERIDADIVIVGIGVEPRLQLAEAAGLTLDRGVLVNSRLQSSDPNIFAAGDIACWPDPRTGENIRVEHWVVAERQGQVAAANMLGGDQLSRWFRSSGQNTSTSQIRYVGHAAKWDQAQSRGRSFASGWPGPLPSRGPRSRRGYRRTRQRVHSELS